MTYTKLGMLQVAKENNNYIISFNKEINRINLFISEEVKDILTKFVNQPGSRLILDLQGIKFIDTTGFTVLLYIYNSAKENGCSLSFRNIDPDVLELFEVAKVKDIFEICKN
ncbi:MAG: STAS domain-containing protein [Bacteroidales bacterium]|nr:STAS domain-containing protein [Bacteroidales bacterium]